VAGECEHDRRLLTALCDSLASVSAGFRACMTLGDEEAFGLSVRDLPFEADGGTFPGVEFRPYDGWSRLAGITTANPGGWLPPGRQAALLKHCHFFECAFTHELSGVRFEHCTFHRCKFHLQVEHAEFLECDFTSCNAAWSAFSCCKMKFSRCTDNTFGYSVFFRCDLYRSSFFNPSNTFSETTFSLVSISRVSLDGTTGLARPSFYPHKADRSLVPGSDVPNLDDRVAQCRRNRALEIAEHHAPLIQEDEQEYRWLLKQTDGQTSGQESSLNKRLSEAAGVWRGVSGLLTERGDYRDAAWAYMQAKRRERQDANPLRKRYFRTGSEGYWRRERRPVRASRLTFRFGTLFFADVLCGFGNAFGRIILWIGALTAVFAAVLTLGHGVELEMRVRDAGNAETTRLVPVTFFQAWEFAVGQLATSPAKEFKLVSTGWSVAASAETLLGIALVGLFGFVVANRIRFA